MTRTVSLIMAVMVSAVTASAAEPAYRFRSPFDVQQCGLARDFADRAIRRDGWSPRMGLLHAEALLCRGLTGDPWALAAAASAYEDVLGRGEAGFYAVLGYADALRKRYPLSDEAAEALQRAAMMLDGA